MRQLANALEDAKSLLIPASVVSLQTMVKYDITLLRPISNKLSLEGRTWRTHAILGPHRRLFSEDAIIALPESHYIR